MSQAILAALVFAFFIVFTLGALAGYHLTRDETPRDSG